MQVHHLNCGTMTPLLVGRLVCHVLLVGASYLFLKGLWGAPRALAGTALCAFSPLLLGIALWIGFYLLERRRSNAFFPVELFRHPLFIAAILAGAAAAAARTGELDARRRARAASARSAARPAQQWPVGERRPIAHPGSGSGAAW